MGYTGEGGIVASVKKGKWANKELQETEITLSCLEDRVFTIPFHVEIEEGDRVVMDFPKSEEGNSGSYRVVKVDVYRKNPEGKYAFYRQFSGYKPIPSGHIPELLPRDPAAGFG
jgi:hypothetical protein